MAGALPDVLALPVAEAIEQLNAAGCKVVKVEATGVPGQEKPGEENGRVARVRIVGERAVEIIYVATPELSEGKADQQ